MPLYTSNSERARWLMGRFAAFSAALAIALVGAFLGSGRLGQWGRMGTSHDKHRRLVATEGGRVVLLGGSSVHYGMDSELLERRLGRPVVNMGLQGSIGMNFMFSELQGSLREGDWLVVALEHAHYGRIDPDGEAALYKLLSVRPSGIRHLNTRQWVRLLRMGWIGIRSNLGEGQVALMRALTGTAQFRDRSNERGDYEGHRGKRPVFTSEGPIELAAISARMRAAQAGW